MFGTITAESQRLVKTPRQRDLQRLVRGSTPTTARPDVEQLLGLLDRSVGSGKSVIEHHQAVVAHADWIVDLGPGAGHDGGTVVFEGDSRQLVADASTVTGRHLAAHAGS